MSEDDHDIVLFCSQWDSIENKTSVVIYGGGALLALWLSSSIISAVNSVPLVRYMYLDSYCLTLSYACIYLYIYRYIYAYMYM